MRIRDPGGSGTSSLGSHPEGEDGKLYVLNWRWDTSILEWVKLEGGADGIAADVTVLNTVSVSQSGIWNINDITGTISLPTGAATSANQATIIASLSSIDAGIPAALGQATMANSMPVVIASNQTAFPVSQSGSWTVAATQSGTWNINNISGTISLPTGASTAANQATIIASLSAIDAGIPAALGQTTMAASMPVAIASNQSAIPVSQSGTWNITNISGTVSLPTGASTSANQTTEITSLQLIDDIVHAMNGAFSKSAAIGGQFDDTSTTAATEDNIAPLRITAQRAAHINLRNVAGTEIGTSGAPVRVDPTGTTPQPASQSGTWNITNISGTVSLPTGAATETTLAAINTKLVAEALNFGNPSAALRVAAVLGNGITTADFAAGSVSAQTLGTVERSGATPTLANVSTSTSSVQLLASATGRLSATIFNDSTSNLLVKYGTTASATSYTTKIPPGQQGFLKSEYNGRIDGILEAGTGTARVTEVTA